LEERCGLILPNLKYTRKNAKAKATILCNRSLSLRICSEALVSAARRKNPAYPEAKTGRIRVLFLLKSRAVSRFSPGRLRQCLINLIGNAVKFTEEGHIYVKVSLEGTENQPYIRFDVEDTGIGIPVANSFRICCRNNSIPLSSMA